MTKRVLHVFTAMNVGGAETMILNLYRAINREKIQFDFLVHTEEPGYYEKEIIALGGRIFRLPYPKIYYLKSYQKQLLELLRQYNFSAIHSHAHSFSGFILYVANKVPIPIRIAHSHTTSDGKKETLFRQFYQSYMKMKLRKYSTHKFGCSSEACESLFGKDVQTFVLPNSFNLQEFEEQANITGNKQVESPVVGHIGRFDPVKNHPFFIETFYHFKQIYPNASAILIGDGPDKDKIQALIKHYNLEDSVKLLGVRTDIPKLLSRMDIFLFPSLYEGLGNVIIEAQAAGIPCLVSDTVPREVNLSMNLVTFKNLSDGAETWAGVLEKKLNVMERLSWEERKVSLEKSGYDVSINAKFLEGIYIGSKSLWGK
jgi:glycosyltransferase EpsF